ncbi:hypothetical protein D931_02201 [Enterococcus faecium 13.SD.W.09]|nr:hypothetical protein D931_02201 [Enterococcus faecium 13.SD.W.09]
MSFFVEKKTQTNWSVICGNNKVKVTTIRFFHKKQSTRQATSCRNFP